MQDESGNSSPVAREQASALPPTTNKAASITSKLVMADVKQTRALRPKGPLFPIRPPTAPTSYTVPKRAGAALDFVTAKDDGKRKFHLYHASSDFSSHVSP